MARIQHNATLNRLVVDLGRSLLQFIGEVSPWSPQSATQTRDVIARLVAEQRSHVESLAALLVQRGCHVDYGVYPAEFTDLHFLSLKSLIPRVISSQLSLVNELDEAAHVAVDDSEVSTLLNRVLSSEKAATEELKTLKV